MYALGGSGRLTESCGTPSCLAAVGSLGDAAERAAFLQLPPQLPALKYIGFAVTDGGIAKGGQAIADLAEFLFGCFHAIPSTRVAAGVIH